MGSSRTGRWRALARMPGLGPWLVALVRLRIALRAAARGVGPALRWWWRSREVTNFTYDLTERNRAQLAAFVAAVSGAPLARAAALLAELEADEVLRRHVRRTIAAHPDAGIADAEPRYARRAGWYALVRLLRPRVVVETGVDKGLGACVLAAALARNAAEGFPGTYHGIDPNPAAGYLLSGPYARFGRIVTADALEALPGLSGIDLFVHDSDHSEAHEAAEYRLLAPRLSDGAVVLSDNAHATRCLFDFARSSKRRFLYFAEEPRDHWYPGAGIGAAFP